VATFSNKENEKTMQDFCGWFIRSKQGAIKNAVMPLIQNKPS
jgi:hypothetical protein